MPGVVFFIHIRITTLGHLFQVRINIISSQYATINNHPCRYINVQQRTAAIEFGRPQKTTGSGRWILRVLNMIVSYEKCILQSQSIVFKTKFSTMRFFISLQINKCSRHYVSTPLMWLRSSSSLWLGAEMEFMWLFPMAKLTKTCGNWTVIWLGL